MPALIRPSRRSFLVGLAACLLLAGCGYTWRGQEGSLSEDSVLGKGDKTLRIRDIDQTTLYPWLPYMIRSQIRDDRARAVLSNPQLWGIQKPDLAVHRDDPDGVHRL